MLLPGDRKWQLIYPYAKIINRRLQLSLTQLKLVTIEDICVYAQSQHMFKLSGLVH